MVEDVTKWVTDTSMWDDRASVGIHTLPTKLLWDNRSYDNVTMITVEPDNRLAVPWRKRRRVQGLGVSSSTMIVTVPM